MIFDNRKDSRGNLIPLMLSEIVKAAVESLEKYGDMPVGVETCVPGYEYNEEHSLPVSAIPVVDQPEWLSSYWRRGFTKAFIFRGV